MAKRYKYIREIDMTHPAIPIFNEYNLPVNSWSKAAQEVLNKNWKKDAFDLLYYKLTGKQPNTINTAEARIKCAYRVQEMGREITLSPVLSEESKKRIKQNEQSAIEIAKQYSESEPILSSNIDFDSILQCGNCGKICTSKSGLTLHRKKCFKRN